MANKNNTPKTLDLASLSQEDLLAKAIELQASNETLTAEKSELEKLVEQLSVANESKTISNGKTLTVDGKNYEVLVPKFYLSGKIVTVEDCSVDPELLKKALELKCIKEVELI